MGEICFSISVFIVGVTYTDYAKNNVLYADYAVFRTGDLGRIDEDGYLWITGRAKDLIIRSGHNIDPAEIEEALAGHEAVAFAGAIGQPDSYAGELPCAYVELIEGGVATPEELTEFVNARVSERAAQAKYLEILPELPKTAVGKVFKPALRKSAITRIFNEALVNASTDARVVSVIEDKQRGLVAQVSGSADDAAITEVLGEFIRPWERIS